MIMILDVLKCVVQHDGYGIIVSSPSAVLVDTFAGRSHRAFRLSAACTGSTLSVFYVGKQFVQFFLAI